MFAVYCSVLQCVVNVLHHFAVNCLFRVCLWSCVSKLKKYLSKCVCFYFLCVYVYGSITFSSYRPALTCYFSYSHPHSFAGSRMWVCLCRRVLSPSHSDSRNPSVKVRSRTSALSRSLSLTQTHMNEPCHRNKWVMSYIWMELLLPKSKQRARAFSVALLFLLFMSVVLCFSLSVSISLFLSFCFAWVRTLSLSRVHARTCVLARAYSFAFSDFSLFSSSHFLSLSFFHSTFAPSSIFFSTGHQRVQIRNGR